MRMYFLVNKDGYLSSSSSTSMRNENQISLNLSEDHEAIMNPDIFKYIDGKLIKDEERQEQLVEEQEKENSKLSIEDQNSIAILELAESIMKLGGK